MKECVASLSIHETSLPLIRAMIYKRLGLGLILRALAIDPPFTFGPWHEHDVFWYHKANI